MAPIQGESSNPNEPAVHGKSTAQDQGMGVMGEATRGSGVIGTSTDWIGVYGESARFEGVRGTSKSKDHAGVVGTNEAGGVAVYGAGDPGPGVIGMSTKWVGVYGETASVENGPAGVWGEHKGAGIGIKAISNTGIGLFAFSNGTAAKFQGDIHVTGNILADGDIVLSNADCAEDFDIVDADIVEPGTVMVVGDEGVLQQSGQAYDKRVAGVISGAGNYKPGIVLDKQHSQSNRKPIALLGKVYCKVDASYAPIEVGDLLTTAPTPGHAMKATDPLKAFGAVIGKALRPLREGQGLVPILIALQ